MRSETLHPAVPAAPTDQNLAALLAERAGGLLCKVRAEIGFDSPDHLRAEGDRQSHALLVAEGPIWLTDYSLPWKG